MPSAQLDLFHLPLPTPAGGEQTRRLLFKGRLLDYQLKTGRRRLSMTIDDRGLRLGAPTRLPRAEIEAFILQHGDWVLQKLDELASRTKPRHLRLVDGARLPLLGDEITVRILPGANRIRWIAQTLLLEARPAADLGQLATRALKNRALEHFSTRLAHYTAQLEQPMPPLGLSSARTRWGSCSRVGGIRIHWRLIHLPPHLGDYVVAHETAHLIEMNHGPRFWRLVERLYPDWQSARHELKTRAASLPILL